MKGSGRFTDICEFTSREVICTILREFTGRHLDSDPRAGPGRGGVKYWEDALDERYDWIQNVCQTNVQMKKDIIRLEKELEISKHKEEISRLTEELRNPPTGRKSPRLSR